jgi:hypothetical protein
MEFDVKNYEADDITFDLSIKKIHKPVLADKEKQKNEEQKVLAN